MGTFSYRDLCGPNPNPLTLVEAEALRSLVLKLPNIEPVIVQIGAERGTSTLAMLDARRDAFIFSIDTAPCEVEFGNLIAAGLDKDRVVRLLGRSQDIGKYFPYMVDMIFVDGDHSEAGVRGDINTWLPHLDAEGIIVFHDYIPEPIPPGIKGRVVYAVDDWFSQSYFERILWVERLIAFQRY